MLRHHYTPKHFWEVPDEDGGDLGIEFFTADGTIYQCYYPDIDIDMATYKKKIQKKIREDLQKLESNASKIEDMLDGIKVDQWVLLTPENRSKDLIKYASKKAKEVKAKNLTYIDNNSFIVKVETADIFPDSKMFALGVCPDVIDIPIPQVSQEDVDKWVGGNSDFFENISRKSDTLMGDKSERFQGKVIQKYIQIEKVIDALRDDHPDIYNLVEDTALARLDAMKEDVLFEDVLGDSFVKGVVKNNGEAFKKHAEKFSEKNLQALSFGYLSRWLAECYMDFE
jgi:CRISPR/Cas system-associated endonuclease Cas3-HD